MFIDVYKCVSIDIFAVCSMFMDVFIDIYGIANPIKIEHVLRTDLPKYCSVVNYRLAAFFGVCWAFAPKINGAHWLVVSLCFLSFSRFDDVQRDPCDCFLHGTVGSKPLSSFILNIVYMLLHVFVCVSAQCQLFLSNPCHYHGKPGTSQLRCSTCISCLGFSQSQLRHLDRN